MTKALGNLVDEIEKLIEDGTIPNNLHTNLALISLNKVALYLASAISYEKRVKDGENLVMNPDGVFTS